MTAPEQLSLVHLGACADCQTVVRRDDLPHVRFATQMLCPTCTGYALVTLYPVKGKAGKGRCDSRCTNSRTRYCSCQCGGRNHGADHAWTVGHGFAAQVVSS